MSKNIFSELLLGALILAAGAFGYYAGIHEGAYRIADLEHQVLDFAREMDEARRNLLKTEEIFAAFKEVAREMPATEVVGD